VFDLSTGDVCVIEPRMTGLMLLADPPDREHLRIEWRFAAGREGRSSTRSGSGTTRARHCLALHRGGTCGEARSGLLGPTPDERRSGGTTGGDRPRSCALDQKLTAGIGTLCKRDSTRSTNPSRERADRLECRRCAPRLSRFAASSAKDHTKVNSAMKRIATFEPQRPLPEQDRV
jgi:formamidopyrimidine-DNA glycosylase